MNYIIVSNIIICRQNRQKITNVLGSVCMAFRSFNQPLNGNSSGISQRHYTRFTFYFGFIFVRVLLDSIISISIDFFVLSAFYTQLSYRLIIQLFFYYFLVLFLSLALPVYVTLAVHCIV